MHSKSVTRVLNPRRDLEIRDGFPKSVLGLPILDPATYGVRCLACAPRKELSQCPPFVPLRGTKMYKQVARHNPIPLTGALLRRVLQPKGASRPPHTLVGAGNRATFPIFAPQYWRFAPPFRYSRHNIGVSRHLFNIHARDGGGRLRPVLARSASDSPIRDPSHCCSNSKGMCLYQMSSSSLPYCSAARAILSL